MDEQLIELLRDRFDALDRKLDDHRASFDLHAKNDEKYWKMIDSQRAQVSLIKWLTGGAAGSSLLAWLFNKFGHIP